MFTLISWKKQAGTRCQTQLYSLPKWARSLGLFLAFAQLLPTMPMSAWAQDSTSGKTAPTSSTPKITINRHAPKPFKPDLNLQFPANPTAEDISATTLFPEKLLPFGGTPSSAENQALAKALVSYSKEKSRENVAPITAFIEQYSQSAWKADLEANLGILYRESGRYSLALDVWEKSWALLKANADPNAQLLADRVLGELSLLLSSLGRTEELRALLAETKDRALYGSSFQQMVNARENLWVMDNHPGDAYKCGPYALQSILNFEHPKSQLNPLIAQAASTKQGFSLVQVEALSNRLNMNLQIAKRSPGASILFPAVLHWKAGHYAAIIKKVDDSYLVQDPTFGNDVFVSADTVDSETSGYFLVAAGPLPTGWQTVSVNEAATVWGRGVTSSSDPNATTPGDNTCKTCPPQKGMAQYNIFAMLLSLHVQDQPVGYAPPVGPSVNFVVTFNQFEANQPGTFTYSNLGPLWVNNWMSYVVLPPNPISNPEETTYVNLRGGGRETFPLANYHGSTVPGYILYFYDTKTEATLWVTTSNTYERRLPDGSVEKYATPNGAGLMFLTQVIDPQGNTVNLTYDGSYRLTAITDALGQVTTLSYGFSSDPLKITKVTDPFGRSATFTYNGTAPYQLSSITDEIGITSQLTYGTGSMMTALTTPYGKTAFNQTYSTTSEVVRSLEVVDPLGGKEFYMRRLDGFGYIGSEAQVPTVLGPVPLTNQYLQYRNTYYWNKKAVMDYGETDYTKAEIFHFLHVPPSTLSQCGVLESIKQPLESRVWYRYLGQTDSIDQGPMSQPTTTARVLSDGTSQVSTASYNSLGNLTQSVDPLGRTITYDYDTTNNIDVLDVRQTKGSNNDALLKMTYNSAHRPLTITDASGQVTTCTYNTQGQLTQVTDAKGNITTYTYTGPAGTGTGNYLTQIVGPAASGVTGDSTTLTYDAIGRVSTITDSQGYVLSYVYDNLDRVVAITYPDGTYDQNYYSNLDLVWHKDRLNRWTHNVYDAQEQLLSTTDPLGRITNYSWCLCGAMTSLTDPVGNVTSWNRDVEGRITAKIFPDSSRYQYVYDPNTNRLQSYIDAKGQATQYAYNADDTLSKVSYTKALNPTPSVSYTYDSNYTRLTSMIDGTGTTTYTYNPYSTFSGSWPTSATTGVGRLATESSPLLNSTIAYSYDELGRVLSRTINGTANSNGVTYDSLGRVNAISNNLGSFTPGYVSTTNRLSSLSFPNGLSEALLYFNNVGDQRLQEIAYTKGATAISKFDYTYNSVGDITSWQRQADSSTPTIYGLSYDAADQLSEALLTQSGSTVHRYVENYDPAGNRTSEQIDLGITSSTFNNLNQLTGQTGGGPLRVSGTLNQASNVTVNGSPANSTASTSFTSQVATTTGTNVVTVVAQNLSGQASTNRYQIVIPPPGSPATRPYDPNGNLVSNAAGQSYTWDAADRLTMITYSSGATSAFSYDGLGRRTKIVETNSGGTVTATRQLVWVGNSIAEERDASDTVQKRFYAQGEQISGANYYYTRDHLGSVREMTDGSGTIQARYDYDPYGRTTLVSGTNLSDFQYAGMYMHQPSGLNLTLFRFYDPTIGRWLSRDPMGEGSDATLYSYVWNDPANLADHLGLMGSAYNGIPGARINPNGNGDPMAVKVLAALPGVAVAAPLVALAPVAAVGGLATMGLTAEQIAALGLGGTALINGINGQGGTCPLFNSSANAARAALGKGQLASPGSPLTPQMLQALNENLAAAQANLNAALNGVGRNGQPLSQQMINTVISTSQARISTINTAISTNAQAPKN